MLRSLHAPTSTARRAYYPSSRDACPAGVDSMLGGTLELDLDQALSDRVLLLDDGFSIVTTDPSLAFSGSITWAQGSFEDG